tara:strand:- start:244 stop:417 length:174 start_codon:yes stop_codon:yes gene_type:complete
MKEINKAGMSSWMRDKRVVKVLSSDNLTSTEEKELNREVQSIRRRGNGVCVLLIETK